ncbi:MAG: fimbrillin family protein [Tannerellaceae bacterium]|nr:fimbrillin family protein [Tannerellaceae bacterium]
MAVALLLTGCMIEETTVWNGDGTGDVPVRFNAGIGIETRVSNPAGDEWEATDTIGVYMIKAGVALADSAIREGAKNKPYTVSSGIGSNTAAFETASDTTYYPNGEEVNFVAYYPYSDQGTVVSTDYKYTMDISDQSNPSRLDLLYSNDKAVYSSTNHDAKLPFEHLMTRVVFDALRTGNSNASLAGLQLEVLNVNTLTTFDLTDGAPALDGAGQSNIIPQNRYTSDDSVRMEATLIPMVDASGVHLTFLLNNKTYRAALPPTAGGNALLKGKRYTYKVLFNEAEITLEGHLSAWGEEPGDTIIPTPDPYSATIQIEGYTGQITITYASGDRETLPLDAGGKADLSSVRRGELIHSLTLGSSGTPIFIGRKVEGVLLLSLKVDGSGNPILRDEVDGYIPIGSYAELKLIAESANLGKKYKQENAIDLLNENLTPIGTQASPFTGEYDGGEYGIMNLKIDVTTDRIGLFGQTNSATLRNIRLVSGAINAGPGVGSICGYADGSTSITNCHSGVAVTGTFNIGGICGHAVGTTIITSCRNTGNVKGTSSQTAGGISFSRIGGIVGYLVGTTNKVKDCGNSGEIEGYRSVGGIAGLCDAASAEIIACRNSGIINNTGNDVSGGIVGENRANKTLVITACYNTGAVSHVGSTFHSGGIIGGFNIGSSTLTACYNTGTVTGSNVNLIGFICGYNRATITSCYWTKGSSTVTKGVADGTDDTKEFTASAWPITADSGWGIGDGSADNTYWKSLGGWNGGVPEYPALWWE